MGILKYYDTSTLLEHYADIDFTECGISSKTIEELENIKTSQMKSDDIKYRARQVTKAIDKYSPVVKIVTQGTINDVQSKGLEVINDNLIVSSIAYGFKEDDIFYSEDYIQRLIAKNYFGICAKKYPTAKQEEYKGFKIVNPDDERLDDLYPNNNANIFGCLTNEYIIVKDDNGNDDDVLKWTGEKYVTLFNKSLKTIAFGDRIKPKDVYQKAVIDSIMTNQITAISGSAGSGKSLLSLLCGLYLVEKGTYDRIVILFNPCPVRGATQLGYYSGSRDEKSILSNIGNMLISKLGDRFTLESYMSQGKIVLLPMVDCRGMEISDNEILYITEAENTTADLLKICLTRISSGAKAIIEGDYNQIDSKIFESNNGLKRMIDTFAGHKCFGMVELQNVWRSHIADIADKM